MFSGTHKEYQIAEHVQAEMRAEADRYRLVDDAQRASHEVVVEKLSILRNKWGIRAALIALVLAAVLIGTQHAFAGGPHLWPGQTDPFGETNRAYREGLYCLNHGDYEGAIVWLTQAIDSLPEEVILREPVYQDLYWALGEAQEGAGLYFEALASYQHWLTLARDEAAPWTLVKVKTLAIQVYAMMIADIQA